MRIINHPVLCNYYVTYRCNAACGFCDIWEKPSPYIRKEDVETNLRDLKRLKVKVIDFTGGEPLLHRELPEFLRMAKDMGFITTITTNCLLYPKYGEKLKGLVDMLHFSLDSVQEEKHNLSRQVNCFDHVMKSIELAKKWGERPDILFTVTNDNIDEVEMAYQEYVVGKGLHLILNPVFEYAGVGTNIERKNLEYLESKWLGKQGVYLNEVFIDLRKKGGNDVKNPVCQPVSSTIVISPENELVLPCYHLGLEKIPINGNLYSLYKGPEITEHKEKEGRHKECDGCVINCYIEPSLTLNTGSYFKKSLKSTLTYSLEKWVYG